jgi:hypothetical protein
MMRGLCDGCGQLRNIKHDGQRWLCKRCRPGQADDVNTNPMGYVFAYVFCLAVGFSIAAEWFAP